MQDGENGLVWNTQEELEEKTKDLIKNTKLWETLSENAQKTAEKFTGVRFCQEIRELIA